MRYKIKVAMLPVKDETYQVKEGDLFINDSRAYTWGQIEVLNCERVTTHGHAWSGGGIQTYINHLYVTVSRKVESPEVGDWCLNVGNNEIILVTKIVKKTVYHKPDRGCVRLKDCRKVIATTDPKLNKGWIDDVSDSPTSKFKEVITHNGVPQVPRSFLKEFVTNPGKEWEVEYECLDNGMSTLDISDYFPYEYPETLKVDSTNTITPIDVKMYSKHEYVDGLMRLANALYPNKSDDESNMKLFMANWVKNNL